MASCFQHINECLYVVKSQLRSHWALLYYTTDGRVEIANNAAERA